MTQMEAWDDAGFRLHDAELAAKKARDAYKNALRKKNYGFYAIRATFSTPQKQEPRPRRSWRRFNRPSQDYFPPLL
jgi:hypothetical protein